MQFTPKTEEDIIEGALLAAGVYPFEINEAVEKESKTSGKPMIELKLSVFEGDRPSFIRDYLMESVAHKLRHACVHLGMEDKYNSGSINPKDFVGKTGYVKVNIQKGKPKNDGSGESWPSRNSIADYVAAPSDSIEGDDIPF